MENIEPRTDGDHIVAQALETALGSKVEKEPGMGLSSNDYTAAEKAKLAGLENFSLPTFTYRNLCCNSRGDNLNGWKGWSTADKVAIDTVKFGRPVIQLTNQYQGAFWWIGLIVDENCPDLKQYIGTEVPLPQPVTVSYDMWCNYAVEVRAWHESADVVTIAANKFQRVKHTISAGTVLENVGTGVALVQGSYDLEAYYENVQVEWGTEATPYCYNATLPMSLEEQLVPGEFWDGKQVYVRAFKGTVHGAIGGNYIARSCFKSNTVNIVDAQGNLSGYLSGNQDIYFSFPIGTNWSVRSENNSLAYSTERADMGAMMYIITIKYVQ